MNTNIFKKISIVLVLLTLATSCSAIPGLNEKKEDNSGILGVLLLVSSPILASNTAAATVSGKLTNSSGSAIVGASLSVGAYSGSERGLVGKTVSTSATTDSSGNWTLNLAISAYTITVTSSSGQSLGQFTLVVASASSAIGTAATGASFTVSGVTSVAYTGTTTTSATSTGTTTTTCRKYAKTYTVVGGSTNLNYSCSYSKTTFTNSCTYSGSSSGSTSSVYANNADFIAEASSVGIFKVKSFTAGSSTTTYTYDSQGRLSSLTAGSTTGTYSNYDSKGRPLSAVLGSTNYTNSYDDTNRTWTSVRGSTTDVYTFDANMNITKITITGSSDTIYTTSATEEICP